jgi:site-specific DNA-methyltransferase (adenine-specific)
VSAPAIDVLRGNAIEVLRRRADASVDMVYLDPPFGTQKEWTGKAGRFSDRFAWDRTAQVRAGRLRRARPRFAAMFDVLPIGDRDRAYLAFLGALLLELHRVMKPAASLWLHCDDTMGAYIRLMLDAVFGHDMFFSTVVWRRTSGGHNMKTRSYGRVHDSIHVYCRTQRACRRLLSIDSELGREGFSEVALNPAALERVGYPTQKPVVLLEQILAAGSRRGDLVLDPTCGSGTTLVAAHRTGRRAIGIDRSAAACKVARTRVRFAGKMR